MNELWSCGWNMIFKYFSLQFSPFTSSAHVNFHYISFPTSQTTHHHRKRFGWEISVILRRAFAVIIDHEKVFDFSKPALTSARRANFLIIAAYTHNCWN